MATTAAQLGALIRERREQLRLSMDELAMRARVSRSSVHRMEHGHAVRAMPAKLARVLDIVGITEEEARLALQEDGDSAEYIDDVVHWMGRTEALSEMAAQLQATPHQALSDKPDLVVIDQTSGEVSQVYGGNIDRLAQVLGAAGLLVTQPRD